MPRDSVMQTSDDERRRFFRIEDAIHLSLRLVTRREVDERLRYMDEDGQGSFTLMTALAAIGTQVSAALRRIESKDPDIGDYLKALDKKIDLIGRALLTEEVDITDKPVRAVNLSAGGIAVRGRNAMEIGTLLEIRMLLLPSYTGILTYGSVVNCCLGEGEEADQEYPYLLRIDFSFMREVDRDALIRHVLQRQAAWLRRRRETQEQVEDAL